MTEILFFIGITGAHKFTDDGHFGLALDGVGLGEFTPFTLRPAAFSGGICGRTFSMGIIGSAVPCVISKRCCRATGESSFAVFSSSKTQPLMPTSPAKRCG